MISCRRVDLDLHLARGRGDCKREGDGGREGERGEIALAKYVVLILNMHSIIHSEPSYMHACSGEGSVLLCIRITCIHLSEVTRDMQNRCFEHYLKLHTITTSSLSRSLKNKLLLSLYNINYAIVQVNTCH